MNIKKNKKKVIAAGIAAVLCIAIFSILMVYLLGDGGLAKQLDLGAKYVDELDYEKAIAAYKAAISIDPKCEEAYLALAEIYMALNDPEQALAILTEGYAQTGSEVILAKQLELGAKCMEESDYENAAAVYETVIALFPKREETYYVLADAYIGANNPVKALEVLEMGYEETESEMILTKRDQLAEETRCARLGHEWTEADCTKAKSCSICGETEGEPLGHTLTEADYQFPATCTLCGETEGEPLTPSFVLNHLECIAEEGKTYDYTTVCSDSTEYTTAKLVFSDYRIFEGDETHPAKDGYEWRTIHATITFNDRNAWTYGCSVAYLTSDYYRFDPDAQWEEAKGIAAEDNFSIVWNGEEYSECMSISDGGFGDWESHYVGPATDGFGGRYEFTLSFDAQWAFRVPVGYDGMVLGFYDYAILERQSTRESRENAIMFRLK